MSVSSRQASRICFNLSCNKICSLSSLVHLAKSKHPSLNIERVSLQQIRPSQMLTVHMYACRTPQMLTVYHLSACRIGRLQVNLLSRLVDMVLLCSMAYVPPGTDWHREILVGLHLTRTAFANCGRPLMKSLMMDNVASRHRGKFNALDSVRTFSWSGSAAAGG